MGKTLKLGFAMGGGVSLGTFSGAALTQAIKLAIIYGQDDEGQPYDKVVVDVFSGASAGSMSLSVMLRGLVDQTDESRQAAEKKLKDEFKSDFDKLPSGKKENLIVAQVAQDMQESVWVYEINLKRLLGKPKIGAQRDLTNIASLFDRGAVDDIAKKYFDLRQQLEDKEFSFPNRRLLGDRVLFAHTLTNLTKVKEDARLEFSGDEINYKGLEDGLTSNGHKELRVFDINFSDIKKSEKFNDPASYPSRWCRYHLGAERGGRIGSLRSQWTWNRMIATSIACGSFPFAFEPVVLNRSDYEYGKIWPEELKKQKIRQYPFSYVDGGAFNNEPIREAFRLAAFMDAEDDELTYDRRIIFVDPNVDEPKPEFGVPVHKKYKVESPNIFGNFDGYDLVKLGSLDRMLPHVGTMLSTIMEEAQVIEGDRVFQVIDKFKTRDYIRDHVKILFNNISPTNKNFKDIEDLLDERLKNNKNEMLIPNGALNLEGELKRVILEDYDTSNAFISKIKAFISSKQPTDDPDSSTWLKLLYYILLDQIMNLDGKDRKAQIVAIAPIVEEKGELKVVSLPGRALRAFGGFACEKPGEYEVKLARYCTKLFLEKQKIIKKSAKIDLPIFKKNDRDQYHKELKEGLEDIGARLKQIIKTSHLINWLPGADTIILGLINNQVQKAIGRIELIANPKSQFTFKIVGLPDGDFELDGNRANSDFKMIKEEDKNVLITYLEFYYNRSKNSRWNGVHVHFCGNQQCIKVDIDRNPLKLKFKDRPYFSVELPNKSMIAKALIHPNPIFQLTYKEKYKNTMVSMSDWTLEPGVTTLEDTIIGYKTGD